MPDKVWMILISYRTAFRNMPNRIYTHTSMAYEFTKFEIIWKCETNKNFRKSKKILKHWDNIVTCMVGTRH
jgi:hypothetical protein